MRFRPDNYALWREQILLLAESQELLSHLTQAPPPQYLTVAADDAGSTQVNPTYTSWKKHDVLCRWKSSTLSEESLGLGIGLDSSSKIWLGLEEANTQSSQG
ncbi:hypothetical protein CJ030_MR2G006080 [Morella rubra]|uniref:Retrotransposon Copia-like N-terminal domain-containing protein n=1 Tax=Morella rubra TaxID=262757 RepID=A0A6A1WDB1_9ROSI|nr:hypothetical protein CJ030_MR2G006080 [Morella rubra]